MNSATRVRPAQLPDIARLCLRTLHNGKKKPTTGFQGPDGHGEKIWVFSHRRSDQIIYSFKEQLDVRDASNCPLKSLLLRLPLTSAGLSRLEAITIQRQEDETRQTTQRLLVPPRHH